MGEEAREAALRDFPKLDKLEITEVSISNACGQAAGWVLSLLVRSAVAAGAQRGLGNASVRFHARDGVLAVSTLRLSDER